MSFTRVKPANWAVGESLTSAQMNTLDTDHSNALNGGSSDGVQTDTLHTQVTLSPTGTLTAPFAAGIVAAAAGAIQPQVTGGIQAVASASIQSTNSAGGIQLAGGANDWVTFSASRSRTIAIPPAFIPGLVSGWSVNGSGLNGPGNASNPQAILMPLLHNGAGLSQINVNFAVGSPHTGVPATLPSIALRKVNVTTAADTLVVAGSPGTPGSGAAWYNSGNPQTWLISPGITVDTSSFYYYLVLTDEGGTNALSGNQYYAIILNYIAITSMKFP